jgi:hypothetical protein
MARRPNYGSEKRSKELGKQRKRDEKEEKKRARREAAVAPSGVTRDRELDAEPLQKERVGTEGDERNGERE